MALKTAEFNSTILPYKVVYESALSGTNSGTATAQVDVTQGVAGKLYAIDVITAVSAPVYLKMTLTETSVAVGTTNPQLMLKSGVSKSVRYTIPEGVDFTVLSMWCVTASAVNATTGPGAAVQVTLITS